MNINDLMDDLEQETKIIMVDGNPMTIKELLDKIFTKDSKNKRSYSEG